MEEIIDFLQTIVVKTSPDLEGKLGESIEDCNPPTFEIDYHIGFFFRSPNGDLGLKDAQQAQHDSFPFASAQLSGLAPNISKHRLHVSKRRNARTFPFILAKSMWVIVDMFLSLG